MHITLIGMSNIGKTRWAKRMASEAGFRYFGCDVMIEEMLGDELKRQGFAGIHDMAQWMGFPYDERYAKASRKYIDCERAVMEQAIQTLRETPISEPLVIDTTGSVITAGDDIAAQLRGHSNVIYLEAPVGHAKVLYESYLAHPKPVIWENFYQPTPNEVPQETLVRCYPALLNSRAQRYKQMAHVTIPFEQDGDANVALDALVGLSPVVG